MKAILFSFVLMALLSTSIYSQDVIVTLPPNGSFIINDANANPFLTLDLATGYLTLNKSLSLSNTTSSSLGVIYKGSDRFIHDYKGTGADGNNTFVGINAGNFSMGGSNSFNGSNNTAVGSLSFSSNTTGYYNSAFGVSSLQNNTVGQQNSAFGVSSLSTNTGGGQNSAFGSFSLKTNKGGSDNSAFGAGALYANTVGNWNSAFGAFSLNYNSNGMNNSAFGYKSLQINTYGNGNSAFGDESLANNTSGSNNSVFGFHALYQNSIGANNSAFGYAAGGSVTTGSNLTLIGYQAQPSLPTATGEITLGNSSVTSLRCYAPNLTSLSDARDKKNIKNLELGLDFLMKLQPRQFNWDRREWYDDNTSDGSKMQKTPTAGFIAQELDKVQMSSNAEWLNLVLKSNPNKLEATAGNLLPIIVKAIQDLKVENDAIKTENVVLKDRLTKFEKMQSILFTEFEKIKANNNETTKVSMGEK